MSHFTVLVVGDDTEAKLQPYHEFECTGTDDQYIQNINRTEELRKEYCEKKRTMNVWPDGKLYNTYDEIFYRDPTSEEQEKLGMGSGVAQWIFYSSRNWNDGKWYRAKVQYMPEWFEQKEFPVSELETFRDFVADEVSGEVIVGNASPDLLDKHKYGWLRVDEKWEVIEVISRTNPNSKWDWYEVGGRWAGQFILKEGAKGKKGEQSWFATLKGIEYPKGRVDQACKGDIDFEAMKAEKIKEWIKRYDMFEKIFWKDFQKLDHTWKSLWKEEYENMEHSKRQELYFSQTPLVKLAELRKSESLSKEEKDFIGWGFEYEEYMIGRDAYIADIEANFFGTFAVLMNGNWYEKGEMGWFACVSDENPDWKNEFSKLLESIPDDALLTVVDCHI